MPKNLFTYPFGHEPWQKAWDELKDYIKNGTFASLFKRSVTKPFVIVKDEETKNKRVFLTQEDADIWFAARADGTMTPAIAALEFAGETIPGEEQYELQVNISNPMAYARVGSTGNNVIFSFSTIDKISQSTTGESVDIYFTINNANGSFQRPKVYQFKNEPQSFLLDDFLAPGINTITLLVRGRVSGLSRVVSMTYEMVAFELSSTFDISKALQPSDPLSITYSCKGDYARTVHFCIDGREVQSAAVNIGSQDQAAAKVKIFPAFGEEYGSGTHTLQMKATMQVGEQVFQSDLLYREFEVIGENHTVTLVSADFPSSQDFFSERPGFTGKQYVKQSLVWAFYSSILNTANVLWRLYNSDGVEQTIGSRQADVVEGETDVMPEPVVFMPTEYGLFKLQALVGGDVVSEYEINVEPNLELTEATDGLMVRLTSLGRSNQEDPQYRNDWSSNRNGVRAWCEFSEGFPFTAAAGYNNGGVEFYNGHTGIIRGYQPLTARTGTVTNNGFVFGVRFCTYNMDDENALVLSLGNPHLDAAGIFIYANRAVFRSSAGEQRQVVIPFKDNEDVDLYFIAYPRENHELALFSFAQINGVRCFPRIYDVAENFIVEANDYQDGLIHLGDPNGRCGLRVYSLRCYTLYQGERQLCNNFIIDSGSDLDEQIQRNDIYQQGGGMLDVDVHKLEERMPVIRFTGDLTEMKGGQGKPEKENVGFELTHPDYYDHYAICDLAHLKKAGQSTQDRLGPPSIHVKFNKNKQNILKDRNGRQYPKNRMPILPGYAPENSVRMLNNTLDSSCCHSGGALTFINQIAQDTQIDGQHPLRTPAQDYVLSGGYTRDMTNHHGKAYEFPYKLSFTPVSYAAVAIWRKSPDDPWQWLGLYTVLEEKKAFYTNGGHSIYDALDEDGKPDPYCLKTSKSKARLLYDNTGFLRFEIVTVGPYSMLWRGGEYSFDADIAEREAEIEKISEHDNEEYGDADYMADWAEYGNEVVKRLCPTEGDQEAFDAVIWQVFNIYSVVADFIWILLLCNTDGSFRNINQVRYQRGQKWKLVPWDWDMILGILQETYSLDAQPGSDLYTMLNGKYIFNGMGNREEGATHQSSYWFWDACLKNAEFLRMIPRMYNAMYSAGMKKSAWIQAFDRLTTTFSPALYNVDALGKYINPWFNFQKNYLISDQGDRTAHRHWFIDASVDYFEQQYAVGDYVNKRTSTRANGATNATIYGVAGATAYFGWTISGILTGADGSESEGDVEASNRTGRVMAGESFSLRVDRALTGKDILGVLSPHKLAELDMHEFARFFSAELDFNSCYNDVTRTSMLKALRIGMTIDDMEINGLNHVEISAINGIVFMTRLEVLDIRGLNNLRSNPVITQCQNLHELLAAGSGLTAFNPADGASFSVLELPDTVGSLLATDVTLPLGLRFVHADDSEGHGAVLTDIVCPARLLTITLNGMGSDPGTHALLHRWLSMLADNPGLLSQASITLHGLDWRNATKHDVLTLARITGRRNVRGYVFAADATYTQEEMQLLMEAFGAHVFDPDYHQQTLVCDCAGNGVQIGASGEGVSVGDDGIIHITQGSSVQLSAAGFPLSDTAGMKYRWAVHLGENDNLTGSDDDPVVRWNGGNMILHTINGLLTVLEHSATSVIDLQIICYDKDGRIESSSVNISVHARTYPVSAQVALVKAQNGQMPSFVGGIYQITKTAGYTFQATHLPEGFTGTIREGRWEVDGETEGYMERDGSMETDSLTQCYLRITDLPEDELEYHLRYTSVWRDGVTELTAPTVRFTLSRYIEQLLSASDIAGNLPLFRILEQMGVEHAATGYYNSIEVKGTTGELHAAQYLEAAGMSASSLVSLWNDKTQRYYIPNYLKNVVLFDYSGTNITEFDVNSTPWATSINLEGTYASITF